MKITYRLPCGCRVMRAGDRLMELCPACRALTERRHADSAAERAAAREAPKVPA